MGRLRLAKSTSKRIDSVSCKCCRKCHNDGVVMQTVEPLELGHANTALILALCHVLASKGVLTRDDLNDVVTDAIGELDALGDRALAAAAIDIVKSLLPKIREHKAAER